MASCIIAVIFVQIKIEIYEKKFEVFQIQEPRENEQNVEEEQSNPNQEAIRTRPFEESHFALYLHWHFIFSYLFTIEIKQLLEIFFKFS